MILEIKLLGHVYEFKSVKDILARANEEKSGDRLAGITVENAEGRVAAKVVMANLTLVDLQVNPAVPYGEDGVTHIIQNDVNEKIYEEIRNWTVAELWEWLLDEKNGGDTIRRVNRGLTAETITVVAKLMSNLDLIYVARRIRVTAHCNTTIGLPGALSCRLQSNHPTDDPDGIMASLLEGLTFGAGDTVLGLNPVDDSVESVRRMLDQLQEVGTRWDIPIQICVLVHVTTQMEAARQGAPYDLIFRSIASSRKSNKTFDLDDKLIEEARQLALREGTATGPNVIYFETGRDSELSSEAHHGTDRVVMGARCCGLTKRFQPFLVNTVMSSIGPEYLYNSKQVTRTGLEDHFMGRLTGIPMGCDAYYTSRMRAGQNDTEDLAVLLTAAGYNCSMGIPHGSGMVLNYQTAGFHETVAPRELYGLTATPPFRAWLGKMGFVEDGKLTELVRDASVLLT